MLYSGYRITKDKKSFSKLVDLINEFLISVMIPMRNINSMYSQELAHQKMFVEGLTGGEIRLRLCKFET